MNFKYLLYLLVFVSAFFLVLEFSAMVLLKGNKENKAFFIDHSHSKHELIDSFSSHKYNEVDPLLGWGISEKDIAENGYESFLGNIMFESSNCEPTKTILIMGGSTSDLTYDSGNWPKELFDILDQNNHCVRVIVGAIAGYNSGQELLKYLTFQNVLQPDILISYSGANESENPSYTSNYERVMFENMLNNSKSYFLPNLMYCIKKYVIKNSFSSLALKEPVNFEASWFWYNNMKNFQSFAEKRQYKFYGVLQPVLGQGGVYQEKEMEAFPNYIQEYNIFYKEALEFAENEDYLFEFTDIFHGVDGKVFSDDCHLNGEKYQKIVAQNIYTIIEEEFTE